MSLPTNLSKPFTMIAGTDALAAHVNSDLDYVVDAQNDTNDYINNMPSDDNPLMDGTESPGTSAFVSRKDHVHPSDTTKLDVTTAATTYAPLASPALTGNPTAPTPTTGDNDTSIATTAFVQTAISNLVDAAPGTLDTLNEIAAALGDDPNFAATMTTQLALKAPLASPALTGAPTVPTAAADTSTTQAASTAFVIGQAGTTNPVQDDTTAAVGTSKKYARADHRHPINPVVASSVETCTTKASEASASASEASVYATTAVNAKNAAESAYDAFDDRYLGNKSSDPAVDNDGNALLTGALYFNTVSNEMRVYSGSAWVAAYIPSSSYATLTGTETLTNKTLINPVFTLASSDGEAGQIPIAQGPGLPPVWGQIVTVEGGLTLYITQQTTLTITSYDSATSYSVEATAGTATIAGDTITYTAGSTAGSVTLTITAGSSSRAVTITVNAAGIATPTNSTPTNGATEQSGPTLTLSASAFEWVGLEDTHASTDWELATDSGFTTIVDSSYTDTSNKTSWTADVSTSQTYYWRVRYRGASGRVSEWSTATSFTTKASFVGLIGTAGAQGFGVGVYPAALPSGFSTLTGTTDTASENYGNYQYSDGSIMCFVPKFYYRIGSASSPRYATYGANAVDIAGIETFADEAAANAAGYALHRAFWDGGSIKSGFFIDKYLCSKNGTTSGKSIKNGVPISLTTDTTNYTASGDMTGCTGILADAVVLSRARGTGFNTASIFMYSALALLSLAHGQAATASTYCAWYDAGLTTNFPKGCNNGSLADTNDSSVTYVTAGDPGDSAKPKTGSASNLAKTAHNGQSCGVVDLNGTMYQVMLGLTDYGTSATDTTQHTNGNVYLLKASVALSGLTAGWDGATDAWGNTTSLATKYDAVSGLLPWGSTTGWLYMGNGTNRVLDPATSGAGWQRTGCGIPQDTNALSAGGTNLYGNDGQYQYNRANLFPIASGYWGNAASAGLFDRYWHNNRSSDDTYCGFRASAYGV